MTSRPIQGTLRLTALNETTIYSEHLGQAKIFHAHWRLIVSIDTTDLQPRYQKLWDFLVGAENLCKNKCGELVEIKMLKIRVKRVYGLIQTLQHITQSSSGTRRRRGLINGLGTLSKTLFGTLDANDLDYINGELDKLYAHQNTLAGSLTNQTKIIKVILNTFRQDLEQLSKEGKAYFNAGSRIANTVNNNTLNLYISNQIAICYMTLIELNEDVNTLLNAIGDGKYGIIHPQVLAPVTLINGIRYFEDHFNVKYTIPLEIANYQKILDISEKSITLINYKLVYILLIPLLEPDDYEIRRLIPIPFKHGNNFVAIIPESEILLINKQHTHYLTADSQYLRNCRTANSVRICKRTQPSLLMTKTDSCDSQVLHRHVNFISHPKCQTSLFSIKEIAYLTLSNEKGYIAIPEHAMTFNTICSNIGGEVSINAATLIESDEDCMLSGSGATIKLSHSTNHSLDVLYGKNISLRIPEEDLNLISERLIPLQHQITPDELRGLDHNIDDIQATIDSIKSVHRTHTWAENTVSTLTYLGYISLGLIGVWALNKLGILNCIGKCAPKLCLKICCNKQVNIRETHRCDHQTNDIELRTTEPLVQPIKRINPRLPGVRRIQLGGCNDAPQNPLHRTSRAESPKV